MRVNAAAAAVAAHAGRRLFCRRAGLARQKLVPRLQQGAQGRAAQRPPAPRERLSSLAYLPAHASAGGCKGRGRAAGRNWFDLLHLSEGRHAMRTWPAWLHRAGMEEGLADRG